MLLRDFICSSTAFFATFTATDLPGTLPIDAGPNPPLPALTTTGFLDAVPKPVFF